MARLLAGTDPRPAPAQRCVARLRAQLFGPGPATLAQGPAQCTWLARPGPQALGARPAHTIVPALTGKFSDCPEECSCPQPESLELSSFKDVGISALADSGRVCFSQPFRESLFTATDEYKMAVSFLGWLKTFGLHSAILRRQGRAGRQGQGVRRMSVILTNPKEDRGLGCTLKSVIRTKANVCTS